MTAHEFKVDPDDHGRCQVCGGKGHCPKCNDRADGYGCWAKDDDGNFYKCEDPERFQRKMDLWKFTFEQKEREQLAKLKAKYEI